MIWSEVMQPVEYLEATRLMLLHDDFIPLAENNIDIKKAFEDAIAECKYQAG